MSSIYNVVFILDLHSFYSPVFSSTTTEMPCLKKIPTIYWQLDPVFVFIVLQMEAMGYSETLVSTCQKSLCHVPEYCGIN